MRQGWSTFAAILGIAFVCVTLSSACATPPQQAPVSSGLVYDAQTRGPVAIPASERGLSHD